MVTAGQGMLNAFFTWGVVLGIDAMKNAGLAADQRSTIVTLAIQRRLRRPSRSATSSAS